MQLAVFRINNDTLYGIDIHNVIAFIIKNEVAINDTPSSYKEVEGIATIRNEPNTLINIDKWINKENLLRNDLVYKLIIYSKFNKKTYGFLINDMVGIYDIKQEDITEMPHNSKVKSTCYIEINNKKDLCVLLNFEKLLSDVGVKI